MGDRCRSGGSGHAPCRAGCHVAPPPGPLTRRRSGYAGRASLPGGQLWGEHAPRRGRRETLMGPAAHRSRRPQKRLSPHAGPSAETNERAKGWKVGPRPAGAEDESRVTPGQSNDMADTSGTGLAPVGSPPRGVQPASSTAGACDRATRAAFAQANRCTQTRRTGGGRHRMTGAAADRRVGRLVGNDETSDPNRPR